MARDVFLPSEAEMARIVVTELQRLGYETYEEVSLGRGGQRADIVGVLGPIIAVVECKMSLSLKLLDQLTEWQGRAHRIIGAVPRYRRGATVHRYFRTEGFGLWTVSRFEDGIDEQITPRLQRRVDMRIRRYLRPEQRSGEYARAGASGGGYYTPFRGTVRELEDLAREKPGIELRQAVKEISHHYSSARTAMSSIPAMIRAGVILGLRVEGSPLKLYPVKG